MSTTKVLQEPENRSGSRGHDFKVTAAAAVQQLKEAAAALLSRGETLAEPVRRLMTMNLVEGIVLPVTAVAVSMEKGSVSVATGSRFLSRIGVRNVLVHALDDGKQQGPERFASAISLALRELGVTDNRISFVLPREWTITRVVSLPRAAKENLADVVCYELDRLTPFSEDAAYYDFRLLGEEDGDLKVLLVAAKGDLIDRYLAAFKEQGIDVEKLVFGASALATLAAYVSGSPDVICLETTSDGFYAVLARAGGLFFTSWGALPSQAVASRIETITTALGPVIDAARRLGPSPGSSLPIRIGNTQRP